MFFPRPGSRNIAGETLGEAVKPPQPAVNSGSNGRMKTQPRFQFNLTGATIGVGPFLAITFADLSRKPGGPACLK